MSLKKNIGIVWANPYSGNLGVGALAYSALALVNDVLLENDIAAEISFFGSGRNTPDVLHINDKSIRVNNIRGYNFYYWKSFIKRRLFPSKMNIHLTNRMDYILDIAEGDSFTDIYGTERFNKILSSKQYFLKKGKTQVLLPQTIGPFNNPQNEKLAFDVMSKLDMVISRDRKSYDYTKPFLPEEKIYESIDVAFYLPFKKSNFKNGKINIGINISGLLWSGGYTKNNQFGMATDYQRLIKSALDYFTKLDNVQVHLVPHVIPENVPVEDDYFVSKALEKDYKNLTIAPRFRTPIEAKSYISGLDFFTGARMHSCIAAFSSGVPVFPMAYSRKFNGLFMDTLEYKWMGDCVNDDESRIVQQLIEAYENRDSLATDIQDSLTRIVEPRLIFLKDKLKNVFLK